MKKTKNVAGSNHANRRTKQESQNEKTFEVTGTLRCNKRGFGFLSNIEGEVGEVGDLFVGRIQLEGVLDGDVCAAKVVLGPEELEVRELKTVKRLRNKIVGTAIGGRVLEIDPGVGVGTIQVDRECMTGHSIVAELRGNSWSVVEDLGESESDEALYRRIMERYLLPWETGQRAAREGAARKITVGNGPKRRDLRDQFVITIDADVSRDLDDALAAQIENDGSMRVWVHIADVAEHVGEGTEIDLEAAKCPTSVYLPMKVRPMLPASFSEDKLSLLPGRERDTLTAEMRISANGKIVWCDVYESTIRSNMRLSYATVARHIHGEKRVKAEIGEEASELVGWLWHAATRIGVQRKRRGGVDSGFMRELSAEEAYEEPAHELVERLMVAANEAVAKWLENRGMPALYRCHEAPEEESLLEIEATARAFGYNAALPRPCTPIAFAAFCEQISKSRHASALWDVVGSALERASYQVNNTGHFGLGSESYVHFTSPLRRYADLLVHRVVKSVLNGNENVAGWQRTLISMEDHITETSERASWAERDARAALSLRELKNQPRRKGLGVVRGLNASQVRVRIAELGEVDGVIPVRRLRGGYGYDPVRRELVGGGGSITIGDELMVKAGRIDPVAGALELQVVEAKKNERAANGRGVQPRARKPRPSGATGGRPRGRRGGRGRGKKQTNGQ